MLLISHRKFENVQNDDDDDDDDDDDAAAAADDDYQVPLSGWAIL